MKLIENIEQSIIKIIKLKFNTEPNSKQVQVQKTRKEIEGDYTINVFPLLKISRKKPEETAEIIGDILIKEVGYITDYNIIKGFLNINIDKNIWIDFLVKNVENINYGKEESEKTNIMVEYSSPNTNKPLHLGHLRNNFLGYSVSEILKAAGNKVIKVNLVNDRGIHICKSMLAWQKFGNEATPESTNQKGDKFVGDYYVKFDQEYKKEIADLVEKGATKEEAEKQAPLMKEAQELLRKWEAKEPDTYTLWKKMNNWVYDGFDVTYKKMGISFDKIYYESNTYLLGKKIIEEGFEKGILFKKEDGSIWADLTEDGLDQKLLLRADGTSVYMTQDIGTAEQRFSEFPIDNMIYIVGNEQNYHFQVLKIVLKKLGYNWADNIFHLSYGMVELPEGKMKSREGTVVDADDLIDEMINTAREKSQELGKLDDYTEEEKEKVYKTIALGALKYFILKVDPKKGMMFNPKESIDFNGNTAPFIQYTYTRIKSILRKLENADISFDKTIEISQKETNLIKTVYEFTNVVSIAAKTYSPALISNYVYEIAKEFNQFYHDFPILKAENEDEKNFRINLAKMVGTTIKNAMQLLGIDVPEKM